MAKKYITDEINVGEHSLNSPMMVTLNSLTTAITTEANGNVGIGTINPTSEKLTVQGNIQLADFNPSAILDAAGNMVVSADPYSLDYGFANNAIVHNPIFASTVFNTMGSESMRIDESGNVGIGTTSPESGIRLDVSGNIRSSANMLCSLDVVASGNVLCSGDVVASYSSDKRLKDNLKHISKPIEKIKKIGGYEFDWNDNQDTYVGHDVGVVAQEIEEIMPELVDTRKNGYKAVKYEKLVALLIESIKEQQKQIEELKFKLDGFTK